MISRAITRDFLAGRPFPVIVATNMRSGTHLTIDFIRRNFEGMGGYKLPLETNDNVYLPLDCVGDGTLSEKRVARSIARSHHTLCKVHWCDPAFDLLRNSSMPEMADWMAGNARVVVVYRHPRKVIDSLVVWELYTGAIGRPEIPSEAWLRQRLSDWESHIRQWSQVDRPLFMLSAEDLLKNPQSVLQRLESFFGIPAKPATPLLPPQLRGKWHSRLNRLVSVRPKSTEILTLRPSPQVRWKDSDVALMRELCGKMSEQLGYRL